MSYLMKELINDKGVCRTAPATPGLFITCTGDHSTSCKCADNSTDTTTHYRFWKAQMKILALLIQF